MSTADWQMGILAVGWVAMLGFAIGYPLLARPWWKSQFGRALETSEITMVVLVGLSLLAYWFDFIVPDPVGTAILVLITTAAWLRLIAMVSEQLRKRSDDA